MDYGSPCHLYREAALNDFLRHIIVPLLSFLDLFKFTMKINY